MIKEPLPLKRNASFIKRSWQRIVKWLRKKKSWISSNDGEGGGWKSWYLICHDEMSTGTLSIGYEIYKLLYTIVIRKFSFFCFSLQTMFKIRIIQKSTKPMASGRICRSDVAFLSLGVGLDSCWPDFFKKKSCIFSRWKRLLENFFPFQYLK